MIDTSKLRADVRAYAAAGQPWPTPVTTIDALCAEIERLHGLMDAAWTGWAHSTDVAGPMQAMRAAIDSARGAVK